MPTPEPLRQLLFTDARHIMLGDLAWFDAGGAEVPLIAPPAPPRDVYARPRYVPHGIRLQTQQATKSEPLANVGHLGRVLYDGGLYRTWYLQVEYPPGRDFGSYSHDRIVGAWIAYRESRDGFAWSEPSRSPVEVGGQAGADGGAFFIDPIAPAAERYKIVWMAQAPAEQRAAMWARYQQLHPRWRDVRLTSEDRMVGMYAAVSPDGLSWRAVPEPLFVHKSDTDTSVYFDPWLKRYVMYTRLYNFQRRWVGRAEAEDFYRWGPVEPLLWPSLDELSTDIYLNAFSVYPGVPRQYLMFPMFYHRWDQTSEVRLYSSSDGLVWHATPGGPVIAPGEPRAWDGEFIHAMKDLVPLGADRVGVPYGGVDRPHKYPRWPGELRPRTAWASWPRGRLAAVVATEQGEFHTFPFVPAGRELRLNFRARRGGMIRVGVEETPGRSAAECDPIYGDSLGQPVSWRGQTDLAAAEGKPIFLHVQMRAAELFGVEMA